MADFLFGIVRRQVGSDGVVAIIAGNGSDIPIDETRAKAAEISPLSVSFTARGGLLIGDQKGSILLVYAKCQGIRSDDASVCSGHGSCVVIDQCKCASGCMGADCSITHCFGFTSNHPDVCSGKGECVRQNKCLCHDGFVGHKCQLKD